MPKRRSIMKPEQVDIFIDNYHNAMNNKYEEISVEFYDRLLICIKNLLDYILDCMQDTHNNTLELQCASILDFSKKIEEPMRCREKMEFLSQFCKLSHKLLALKVLKNPIRYSSALVICLTSDFDPEICKQLLTF